MKAPARKSISKKVRFEIFKRDSFTCQYCGSKSPDVILHIDHIKPIAAGGDNKITNLITSCAACNLGKHATEISDNSAIKKQQKQLEEINERRFQLEMMLQWREELDAISKKKFDHIVEKIQTKLFSTTSLTLNETGNNSVRKWIKKFPLDQLLDALEIAASQYLLYENGSATRESAEKAFNFIPRICAAKAKDSGKPHLKDAYYIRGILRNRLHYVNQQKVVSDLDYAFHQLDLSIEWATNLSKSVRNWTQWDAQLTDAIALLEKDQEA